MMSSVPLEEGSMEKVTFQEILEGRKRGGVAHEHIFLGSDVMKGSKLELISRESTVSGLLGQKGRRTFRAQTAGRTRLDRCIDWAVVRR